MDKHNTTIGAKVSPKFYEDFDMFCWRRKLTHSMVIKAAVEKYMADNATPEERQAQDRKDVTP